MTLPSFERPAFGARLAACNITAMPIHHGVSHNAAGERASRVGGGSAATREAEYTAFQSHDATIDGLASFSPCDSDSLLSNKENIPGSHPISAEVPNEDPSTEWNEYSDSASAPPSYQLATVYSAREIRPDAPRHLDSYCDAPHRRESQISAEPASFRQRVPGQLRLYDVHGSETQLLDSAENRADEMEDYVPLPQGSDGSMLSTTQEHEISIYNKIRADLAEPSSLYTSQAQYLTAAQDELQIVNRDESAKSLPETSHSYEKGDLGHVGLSYPSAPTQPCAEEEVTLESNGFSQSADFPEPKTPALPKINNLQSFGTILRGTQMFATTPAQASTPVTGARDPKEPSSPRPTPPDAYHIQAGSNVVKSSPPFHSHLETQEDHVVDLGESSSPAQSFSTPDTQDIRGRKISIYEDHGTKAGNSVKALASGSFARRNAPEPLEHYVSRRESRERRRRLQRHFSEDEDSQTSEDDSLAREVERKRHATNEKAKAARALARVHIRMTSSTPAKEDIEVPGTGRRRSLSEDYIAQCEGHDARDTQQDVIADSQRQHSPSSVPEESQASHRVSGGEVNILAEDSFGNPPACYNEDADTEVVGIEFRSRTEFEQQARDDAGFGDEEAPTSPLENPATQALSELSTNGGQHRMPGFPDAGSPGTADALVPETSPSEVRPFSAINNDFPPDASIHDSEFGFLMSQENHPPSELSSPVRPANRRYAARLQNQKRAKTGTRSEFLDAARQNHTQKESSPLDTEKSGLKDTSVANSRSVSIAEDTSEYVTAPNEFASSVLSAPPASTIESSVDNDSGDISLVDATSVAEEVTPQPRRTGLRSADQVRGPSRLLRKSLLVNTVEVSGAKKIEAVKQLSLKSRRVTYAPADEKNSATRTPLSAMENEADKGETGETPNATESELRESEVKSKHRRLTAPDSLGESSPSLKKSAQWSENGSDTDNQSRTGPYSTARRETRSSRLSSVNNSERAESDEPVEPVTFARSKTSSVAVTATNSKIFAKMAFSVSYGGREEEKLRILKLIKQEGGHLLLRGFDELFDTTAFQLESPQSSPGAGGESGRFHLSLTSEAQMTGFTCLIADEHSRKAKFMQALALGLPCISGRWVEDCVAKREILDWDIYLLAAGESTFLKGAIRSRNLKPYPATEAKLAECFKSRQKLLDGKAIMLVMGRGKAEERKRAYLFLTYALGARRVHRVVNNAAARKALLDAEGKGEIFDWVYVDENEADAERAIFGTVGVAGRKRKRGSAGADDVEARAPKKVSIISDEYVIQSLILGRLMDEA